MIPDNQTPPITALVCTRDRGDSLVCTVESILANDHPDLELIVVDQSADDRTARALTRFGSDPRLRYIRTATAGVSRARNIGLREARSTVVALTDDDCQVSQDWLMRVAAVFMEHPNVAVAFYGVDAAEHDSRQGFIPTYQRPGEHTVSTVSGKCRARGIGAGMALRRGPALALGGFDEMLGPGAPFPACEDGDIAVRALLGGHQVHETDQIRVTHHGFRTYAEGRTLARRNWQGIGAAYAKPLRAGRLPFLTVLLYEFFVMALWPPVRDLLRLRRPRAVTPVFSFLSGFRQGCQAPCNTGSLLFLPVGA